MKLTLISVTTLAACCTLGAAQAQDISYNQAAIQFTNQHLDDYDCHQSGIALNGSKALDNDFFAVAALADVSGNKGCGSTALSLGAGMHTVFGADSSLYGTLSYENISVEHGIGDSGLIAAVGLRGFVSPELEAQLELAHHTAFDGDTQLSLAGNYWINPGFAATGQVALGSETSSISVGIKFNY